MLCMRLRNVDFGSRSRSREEGRGRQRHDLTETLLCLLCRHRWAHRQLRLQGWKRGVPRRPLDMAYVHGARLHCRHAMPCSAAARRSYAPPSPIDWPHSNFEIGVLTCLCTCDRRMRQRRLICDCAQTTTTLSSTFPTGRTRTAAPGPEARRVVCRKTSAASSGLSDTGQNNCSDAVRASPPIHIFRSCGTQAFH